METQIDKVMDDIMDADGVIGYIISDKQGLCLGNKGKTTIGSSGIICSISEQARKLEPSHSGDGPVILLESDHRQCLIQNNDKMVAAIYKTLP